MQDLERLRAQIQPWWAEQHAHQPPAPQPQPGLEGLNYLWNYDQVAVSLGIRPMCGLNCGWTNGRTRNQLVEELRRRIKASAVEAAGILNEPGVETSQQIASALVPQPFGTELTLVTDLIKAAGAQSVQGRNRALVGAGVSALALLWFFFGRE